MREFSAVRLLVAAASLGLPACAQTPPTPSPRDAQILAFQVATVKPARPDEATTVQIRGQRFATTGTTLIDMLKYAYGIHASQVVGGPQWMGTEKFDVLADPEAETRPSSDQMKRMVQALVAYRFQLVFHRATRDLPVYAIALAKNGPRLTASARDTSGIPVVSYTPGWLTVGNATMADFATFMQRYATDRPVVDRTGVAGKYDLTLRWMPDELQANGTATRRKDEANPLPGLFTAIQEQLGLKLEPVKAPIDVFDIDHVEMPSEN
jgi:uncharacterized protein (TIGR03435 family)